MPKKIVEKFEAELKKKADELLKNRLPRELQEMNFENLDLTIFSKGERETISFYTDKYIKRNIFIYGHSVGIGKTHIASAIIHKAAEGAYNDTSPPDIYYQSFPEWIEYARCYQGTELAISALRKLQRCDYLLFDDFGRLNVTEFVREKTFVLLDGRMKNCVHTIYTANLEPLDIAELFGAEIADRVLFNTDVIRLNLTESYRLKKGKYHGETIKKDG
jgi:DNA replication protein DnaC